MAKRKAKMAKKAEIVTRCDQCGGPLKVSAVRESGSAVMANAHGNVARCYGSKSGEQIFLFCCVDCAELHARRRTVA